MDKTKIVVEEIDEGYAFKTNVNDLELLYPLNQIAIKLAIDWGIDKAKYFSLLDEIWEEQKSDYPAKD